MLLTPKRVVDRGILEGRADYEAGRYEGPFDSAEEGLEVLHSATRRLTDLSKHPK